MKLLELYTLLEMIRRELGGDYAPQQLTILLLCAVNNGITQADLAQHLNMPQPTVSRNVRKLEGGYGFVITKDDFEIGYRRKAVFVTDKGKSFIARIKTYLEQS